VFGVRGTRTGWTAEIARNGNDSHPVDAPTTGGLGHMCSRTLQTAEGANSSGLRATQPPSGWRGTGAAVPWVARGLATPGLCRRKPFGLSEGSRLPNYP
jgi:hypothetical protein